MKVGIVVISFNHYLFTKFCIDSIVRNTPRDLYEICLVDNGSTDETKNWAMESFLYGPIDKFISNNSNKGACAASNQGAQWALENNNLTHLLVMANDHIVTPGWLEAMLKAPFDCVNPFVFHSVSEIRALCPPIGRIIDRYKGLRLRYLQEDNEDNMNYVLNTTYNNLDDFASIFTKSFVDDPFVGGPVILWPGLIMYKMEVIREVGFKDEEYLKFDLASYADIDYYVRVYQKGFTSGLTRAAYVHHWGSITTRKLGLRQENTTGYKNNERGAYNHFVKKWGCDPHNLTPLLKKENE